MAWDVFLQGLIQTYGLLGLFVASIISNATVLFVVPIDAAVFLIGATSVDWFYPLIIGVIAGAGSAIGEMTAYILGLLGIKGFEKLKKHEVQKIDEIKKKLNDKGMALIFVAAATPIPFDLIGIAAGLIKYSPMKFFCAALAGKLVRCIAISYGGYFGIGLVKAFFGIP